MAEPEETREKRGLGLREGAIIAEGVAQIGCLTMVIILAALALGLWLDSRLNTRPWLTLGLVLASIPVSIVALVRVALATARRVQLPPSEGGEVTRDTGNV
jgi:hypothetical protein